MAAGGSLVTVGLLWLHLAPALLQQPQPVLFVDPGQAVEIVCETSKKAESKGSVSWYHHAEAGPVLVLKCLDRAREEFSCEFNQSKATLRIASAQPRHAGIYVCAHMGISYHQFGSGTTLLVGDHWNSNSWVRVFAALQDPQTPPSLFCAVGSTAGPVLISQPGGSRKVLGLRGSVGPLLSPMGTSEGGSGLCEVQFNASGTPVRRSLKLHRATDSCRSPGTWVLAGLGLLLLLSLCLSVYCLQRPTPTGPQLSTLMPPGSQEDEAQLTYAHLVFPTPARPRP